MVRLEFQSHLAAPAAEVWAHASSMHGVNLELGPLVRMTHPPEAANLLSPLLKLGQPLFVGWITLLGVIPLDRHTLILEAVRPNGFDERSRSWLQREWVHRRRIEADALGSRVSDVLEFSPRIGALAPFIAAIVAALFRHRHRRLQQRFGKAHV